MLERERQIGALSRVGSDRFVGMKAASGSEELEIPCLFAMRGSGTPNDAFGLTRIFEFMFRAEAGRVVCAVSTGGCEGHTPRQSTREVYSISVQNVGQVSTER